MLGMKWTGSPWWGRHWLGQKAQGVMKRKKMGGAGGSQRSIPENLFSWDTSFHAQWILSCSQTLRLSLCCLGIKEGLPGHQLAGQTPSKHKQVLSGHLKLSKVAVFLLKPVLKVEQTLKCFAYWRWIVYLGPKLEFQAAFSLADMCQCRWLAQGLFWNF